MSAGSKRSAEVSSLRSRCLNWKPMETFLYDWWPLKRRAALYRRIGNADIAILAA